MHQDRKRTTRFIVLSPASPLNDTRRQDQNRHHIFQFSVRVGLPFRTGRTAMVIGKGWTTDLAHGPGRESSALCGGNGERASGYLCTSMPTKAGGCLHYRGKVC